MSSGSGLGIDVKDVRGATGAVAFSEAGNCAVVQQLDPLDRLVNAVAVANREPREALVFFVSWGYLFPGLLLEPFQPLVKVSNGLCILFHLLVVDPVALADGLYKLFGEVAEPGQVVDVEPLDDVSSRCWRDRIDVGDRHGDGGGSTRQTARSHGDVSI